MTETTVEPLAAPAATTAYGIPFITLSNIRPIPTASTFSVQFDTDVACKMAMDWWSQNDPSITASTAVLEGSALTRHSIAAGAFPAGDHTGKVFGFSLRLDATDATGLTLRSYQGFVQLLGARTVAKLNAVPVRWNMFGDGTRPANGGGTGPLLNGPAAGNWSSYTWAQYNPKMTTYPTP
jgi:hypothetical protein